MGYAGIQTKDAKPHWTSVCLDCGKCEKACPQGIKIRDEFKHVQKHLESITAKGIARMARRFVNKGSEK